MRNLLWSALLSLGIVLTVTYTVNSNSNPAINVDRLTTSVVHVYNDGGVGSGFFVTPTHFVTNHHVTQGSENINFRVANDTYGYRANLVATSPYYDIAVYQVDLADLKILERVNGAVDPLRFANSLEVEKGDQVWGIGSGLGFEFNLTNGIVTSDRVFDQNIFLLTDTLILPGNSGGPLLNQQLDVVGMNSLTLTRPIGPMVYSAHLGAAIPSSLIERIVHQALAGEEITENRLGLSIGNMPTNHYPSVLLTHPLEEDNFMVDDQIMAIRINQGVRIEVNSLVDIAFVAIISTPEDVLEFTVIRNESIVLVTTRVHSEIPPIEGVN